jgi:NTE family protein
VKRPDTRTPSPTDPSDRTERIGLVLSGGGARGFAHIGLLRVLERHGVEVDVLAGTSMGAILAALHAHGYRADDLHELAASVSWRDVLDVSFDAGLLKGEKLHHLLATYLPATFAELGRPLAITCTDIEHGEEVTYTDGDLIPIVRASACFPGAFEPVQHAGRTLADGGICNNLPVDALALMRADVTVASDVGPARRSTFSARGDESRSWWDRMVATVTLERRTPLATATLRATDIMMRILTDTQYVHHPADLRIQHELAEVRIEAFWELDAIVAAGESNAEAAFRAQPDLLARLQAASDRPTRHRSLPGAANDGQPLTGSDANRPPGPSERAVEGEASSPVAVPSDTPDGAPHRTSRWRG